MPSFLSSSALVLLLTAGACTPARPQQPEGPRAARDSVIRPMETFSPDVLLGDQLALTGTARFETVTTAELMRLQAINAEERRSAEARIASGPYLGDEARVLRLLPRGAAGYGTATLRAPWPLDRPFTAELLVRLDPNPSGTASLALGFGGEPAREGRRMPSAFEVRFVFYPTGESSVELALGDRDNFSEQGELELPPTDWSSYAHRIGISYAPGTLRITLDGALVQEQSVLIGGTGGVVSLAARGGPAGLRVLGWTME